MPFVPKTWKDAPDTSTPLNGAGLSDLETRVKGGLDEKSPVGHGHTIAQVTGLQSALDGKVPSTLPVLAGGTDLNALTTSTRVVVLSSNAHPNRPSGLGDGVLEVLQIKASSVLQIFRAPGLDPSVWSRWGGSSWTAWRRVDGAPLVALTGGTDLDTILGPSTHSLWSGTSYPHSPEPAANAVLVTHYVSSTQSLQMWYSASGQIWTRARIQGTWGAWSRVDAGAVPPPDPSVGYGAGMKVVPLAMTLANGDLSVATTAGSVRWVRSYRHMPKRVRVHVANTNPRYGRNYGQTAPIALDRVVVGVGAADGSMTSIVEAGGGTLAQDGTEWVSGWLTVPDLTDGGHVAVGAAWSGGAGTAMLHRLTGGGWTNTDPAQVASPSVAGWTWETTLTPLHCWIEAEVPARVPVIVGHGDSITCGTGAGVAVEGSWLSRHAFSEGGIPLHLAASGSNMSMWGAAGTAWGTYPGIDLDRVADAVISTMGQNDLSTDITLATLQARHADMMAALRTRFPAQPVYLGEITPSNKAAAQEQIRRDFNAWRATLPHGERGVIEWAVALSTGGLNEDMDPSYTVDGLHPNDAGYAVMVTQLGKRPVVPFTPSQAQLRAAVTI